MPGSELTILSLYGLFVAITLVLQATGLTAQLGMGYLMSARDEGRTAEGLAARLDRALSNSVTALALFAPAVLIVHLKGASTDQTLLAAQVFLAARIVYLPAYVFGVAGLRTLVWTVGFFATILLYFYGL